MENPIFPDMSNLTWPPLVTQGKWKPGVEGSGLPGRQRAAQSILGHSAGLRAV